MTEVVIVNTAGQSPVFPASGYWRSFVNVHAGAEVVVVIVVALAEQPTDDVHEG